MRKGILIGLMIAAMGMGLGLAQGELMTPRGLPTPLGPYWKKLEPDKCKEAWAAFKEEVKGAYLKGLGEPREVNCLYFERGQKNAMLGWEMGTKTLDQVFTEGWEKRKGTFDTIRSTTGRAKGIVTFQPTPRSFVALVLGFESYNYLPRVEVLCALERENDVVLVEPGF